MARILDVYLHDSKAGTLSQLQDGTLSFSYSSSHLALANAAALSVSMPLREQPYPDRICQTFFAGLLPDEDARRRLAAILGVSEGNVFGLLAAVGGECAGALSLLPQGESPPDPKRPELERLDQARLAETLALLRDRPLLGGLGGVRLSLAGAQDKLAVCLQDGKIALAVAGSPTTHILKPAPRGLDGVVENELFCMKLAARSGFAVPETAIGTAGQIDYLLVERFDRIAGTATGTRRLHQEDFCQALAVSPTIKYEQEGGPGIEQCQKLIRGHTRRPAAEMLAFQRMTIFNYLVGNADAHAKNFALVYRDAVPDLAPFYDLLCTAAYPRLEKRMAMKIGERALADTIRLSDWQGMVPATKVARRQLANELVELAEAVPRLADDLAAELQDQGIHHPILKKVRATIRTRSTRLLQVAEEDDRA